MGNLKKFWKKFPICSISAEKKITFLHGLRLLPTENPEEILEDVFRREYKSRHTADGILKRVGANHKFESCDHTLQEKGCQNDLGKGKY